MAQESDQHNIYIDMENAACLTGGGGQRRLESMLRISTRR